MIQSKSELGRMAALALRNAFWHDFSALTNKYLEAATGLDIDAQEAQMGEMTSIYGRDTKADDSDISLNIWTQNGNARPSTTGFNTLLEALDYDIATEVYLCGKKVFERKDGKWHFTVAG